MTIATSTETMVVDTQNLQAQAWTHRKVTSRLVEFTNETDERVIRATYNNHQKDSYFSPPHHHNFDQLRFVVAGEVHFNSLVAGAGDCVYFPEGTYYAINPLTDTVTTCTVQTHGPSWSLLPTRDEMARGAEELQTKGTLDRDKGVFRWPDGRVQDSYEATWEQLAQQPMAYPEQRYGAITLMRSAHYLWQASARDQEVSIKALGAFNQASPIVSLVRIAAGAELTPIEVTRHQVMFVVGGQATYERDQAVQAGTIMYSAPGAHRGAIRSESDTDLLVIGFEPRQTLPGDLWV